ncbi:MAG TPA: hypothetical protein VMU39_15610 [Solirubrobacteraceae bacterium]|nr:hypothetical protein [Solirubrobacteraceae bacterium]
MPQVLTTNAVIMCQHQGTVTLTSTQAKVVIEGGEILCEPDLVGAPIVGCTQPASTSSKPCTQVVTTTPGSASEKVTVGGRPVYLSTLSGMTDGVPPGTLSVSDPGQTSVQA